jgi:hypothetical protein
MAPIQTSDLRIKWPTLYHELYGQTVAVATAVVAAAATTTAMTAYGSVDSKTAYKLVP